MTPLVATMAEPAVGSVEDSYQGMGWSITTERLRPCGAESMFWRHLVLPFVTT